MKRALPVWILSALFLAACGGSEEASSPSGNEGGGSAGGSTEQPETPPEPQPEQETETEPETETAVDWAAEADKKFNAICAICHGKDGKGDVPAVANYPVKPKDLTDPEWQASVDDDYLRKIIVEGGAAVGKSALMTGAPDLKDKPELLEAVVAKVRGMAAEG